MTGQGFDVNALRKGNGLNNMEARAAELNAKFAIESKKGKAH
jgi:signal transduction histidine kinase